MYCNLAKCQVYKLVHLKKGLKTYAIALSWKSCWLSFIEVKFNSQIADLVFFCTVSYHHFVNMHFLHYNCIPFQITMI